MGPARPEVVSALKLTYLDWPRMLEVLLDRQRQLEAARWALGEALSEVHQALAAGPEMEAAFAREGVSWRRIASTLGLRRQDLAEVMQVARAFPAGKRVSGVGWAHHQRVLRSLPDASLSLRQRWLRDAARHGWTAPTLARRIQEAATFGETGRPQEKKRRAGRQACRTRRRKGER